MNKLDAWLEAQEPEGPMAILEGDVITLVIEDGRSVRMRIVRIQVTHWKGEEELTLRLVEVQDA